MTVFKGYLIIAKQNMWVFLLYLGIFFGITVIIQGNVKRTEENTYTAQSIKLGIVDEDGGDLAMGLQTYLSNYHEITMLENDPKVLQENLFYRNVEYIVRIPADFKNTCLERGESLEVTKIPGSYTSYYVDEQINSFLNNTRTYYAAGFSDTEIADTASQPNTAEVTLIGENGNGGSLPEYTYYFRYIPYMFIGILCYVLGFILSSFQKGDLPKRMFASAVSARSQSLQGLLATTGIGIALWLFCIIMSLVIYGKAIITSSNFIYFLINTFAMLLVAMSMSYLIGTLAKNRETLNGIVNTLSLGMSFLCGVFVSLDVMNKNVKTVAQFLPVYWYERVNDLLCGYSTITGAARATIWQSVGIQLIFAAAFICITLALAKRKRQVQA